MVVHNEYIFSLSATFVAGQTKMLLWLPIQDNHTLV